MTTEIKTKHCVMFLSRLSSSTVTVYYNQYSLFDITVSGISHRYGVGDKLMDLTDKQSLKIVGVDII